eukprot:763369-Hanusia_phi.AAC.1
MHWHNLRAPPRRHPQGVHARMPGKFKVQGGSDAVVTKPGPVGRVVLAVEAGPPGTTPSNTPAEGGVMYGKVNRS